MAFGSVLEGPVQVTQYIEGALPILLSHMKDPHNLVRDTTAWAIGRIALLHHRSIGNALQQVLVTLSQSLEENASSPKVAANICWSIHNIAEVLFSCFAISLSRLTQMI